VHTLHAKLAHTYSEDRAREYGHPSRVHAAELRRSQPQRPSVLRAMFAATVGRLEGGPAAANGVSCTTKDGRTGRLVARFEGTERVFVCEIG
jgi:hypothetical protein